MSSGVASKLLSELKPYKTLFVFSLFCMFLGGLESVIPSWLVKISIDGLNALEKGKETFSILPSKFSQNPLGEWLSGLWSWELNAKELYFTLPILIVIVFAIDAVFKLLHQYTIRLLGLRVVRDLRNKVHNHLIRISLLKQSEKDSGSFVSIIANDLQSLQSWFAEASTAIFSDGFKAIFLFAWLLVIDWRLTLLSLATIPLFAIPVARLGKRIRSYSRKGQDSVGEITSFSSESIYNQKIIKLFNLEQWRQKGFIDESSKLYKLQAKWVWFMALVSPLTNVIGAVGISTILFFGLGAVSSGQISIGDFSSFFVTSILLYDPVKRLGRVATIIQSALGVAERVYEFLDLEAEIESKSLSQLPDTFDLEYKKVSFRYKPNSDWVLKDLNLKIPYKTSLALVGASGGGKTTLVSLLPRFFDFEKGEISIGGVDIKTLKLLELRSLISMVTQEPFLFTGTLRENILLGSSLKTNQELRLMQAVKNAHVEEFLVELKDGLDTFIGERGQSLSLGQRQRVALARAFMSDAPILILDEPTSALDNESQAYVYDSISRLMKDRTVIIIAHRLSTAKSCDQIILIQDGEILERGRHDDLLAVNGAYAKLAHI